MRRKECSRESKCARVWGASVAFAARLCCCVCGCWLVVWPKSESAAHFAVLCVTGAVRMVVRFVRWCSAVGWRGLLMATVCALMMMMN